MKRGVGIGLVCACLTLALAPGASAFSRDFLSVGFRSPAGQGISVTGTGNHVGLTVGMSHAGASYEARGTVTRRHLRATFGRFGSIDMTFEPTGPGRFHPESGVCTGGTRVVRGRFTGSFEFVGDGEYQAASATRGSGDFTHDHFRCRPQDIADDPHAQTGSNGTVLEAGDGEPFAPDTVSFRVIEADRGGRAFFGADALTREGGLKIDRYVYTDGSRSLFDSNVRRHTATVAPPPPFTGQATLTRGPDGPVWSGDLAAEIPAAGTVPLTGPGISAHLFRATVIVARKAARSMVRPFAGGE